MSIIPENNAFLTVKNKAAAPSATALLASRCGTLPPRMSGCGDPPYMGESRNPDSSRESNYQLPQVWAEMLTSYPWDIFGSIVPNDVIHPESLEKLWRVFIHHINRRAYGKNYWKNKNKGVVWAVGWERQRRGAPHGHYLIGGVPDYITLKELHYWLHMHSAHYSELEVYEKDRGGEYYMAKSSYAWKHGEIDISHTLARYQGKSWVSAKDVHEQFCREFSSVTRQKLSAYDWQA